MSVEATGVKQVASALRGLAGSFDRVASNIGAIASASVEAHAERASAKASRTASRQSRTRTAERSTQARPDRLPSWSARPAAPTTRTYASRLLESQGRTDRVRRGYRVSESASASRLVAPSAYGSLPARPKQPRRAAGQRSQYGALPKLSKRAIARLGGASVYAMTAPQSSPAEQARRSRGQMSAAKNARNYYSTANAQTGRLDHPIDMRSFRVGNRERLFQFAAKLVDYSTLGIAADFASRSLEREEFRRGPTREQAAVQAAIVDAVKQGIRASFGEMGNYIAGDLNRQIDRAMKRGAFIAPTLKLTRGS